MHRTAANRAKNKAWLRRSAGPHTAGSNPTSEVDRHGARGPETTQRQRREALNGSWAQGTATLRGYERKLDTLGCSFGMPNVTLGHANVVGHMLLGVGAHPHDTATTGERQSRGPGLRNELMAEMGAGTNVGHGGCQQASKDAQNWCQGHNW